MIGRFHTTRENENVQTMKTSNYFHHSNACAQMHIGFICMQFQVLKMFQFSSKSEQLRLKFNLFKSFSHGYYSLAQVTWQRTTTNDVVRLILIHPILAVKVVA